MRGNPQDRMRLIDGPEALFIFQYTMREAIHINRIFDQVIQKQSQRVTKATIALGELSELDPNVIQQHWTDLTRGTPAEHAQLHIRLIPAEVQCMACFSKYQPIEKKIHCPHCGSFGAKILTGEQCLLESIETEHE